MNRNLLVFYFFLLFCLLSSQTLAKKVHRARAKRVLHGRSAKDVNHQLNRFLDNAETSAMDFGEEDEEHEFDTWRNNSKHKKARVKRRLKEKTKKAVEQKQEQKHKQKSRKMKQHNHPTKSHQKVVIDKSKKIKKGKRALHSSTKKTKTNSSTLKGKKSNKTKFTIR